MTKIETIMLDTIKGGAFVGLTAGTGTPTTTRRSSGSSAATQTALAGVTSALDSLKSSQNNNGNINQMLPLVVMAKWMQNR